MKIVTPYTKTTLLLDSVWMPIGTITARACFHHFLRDRVIGVDKNMVQFHFKDWSEGEQVYNENEIEDGEKVPVVLFGDQPCLRSAKDVWALPTVVIVTEKFFRKPRKKNFTFKEFCIFKDHTCQLCWQKFPRKMLNIDHRKPKAKGGGNEFENLLLSCKRCNSEKSDTWPYFDKFGRPLPVNKIPSNYIFIEPSEMRAEWKDFVWHN
jgi:5-methylcytosine-specific restriction endonuclease McrA